MVGNPVWSRPRHTLSEAIPGRRNRPSYAATCSLGAQNRAPTGACLVGERAGGDGQQGRPHRHLKGNTEAEEASSHGTDEAHEH